MGWLFRDPVAAAKDWYARTKIFPIMHLIGIRKSLVEKHPWLPVNVYKAFLAAKKIAVQELGEIGALLIHLPWVVDHYNETRRVMGEDYWPYGFHENLKTLETFTR